MSYTVTCIGQININKLYLIHSNTVNRPGHSIKHTIINQNVSKLLGKEFGQKTISDRMRIDTIKKYKKTQDDTKSIRKLKWRWVGNSIRGMENACPRAEDISPLKKRLAFRLSSS